VQGTHTNPAFAQQARPLQCHSTLEYSYKEDMWAFIKPKPAATALEKAQDVLCLSASMVMGQSCQFIWDERALGWRRRAQQGAETAARGDRRGSLRPDISEIGHQSMETWQ